MKAYRFILALSVLAVSACSVKEINETAKTSERELTIEAYRADDDAQTKTYLKESDGSVWWVPGDAISLFYGSGSEGGSLFSSKATDTAKVTNFTGTINVITGGAEVSLEDTYFWGLYPYSESASCDGTGVTMTLPAVQTAQAGTFATGAAPSIGRSQGLHMGFYNICGGLKFSVTNAGVKKVTLKSRNGESIAGTAKVSFDAEGLPISEILDGCDEIVLKTPEGQSFVPGKYYYIAMFPTTFTGGFTVTLETLSGIATYEKTTTISAERSVFGKISNIDSGLTYTPKDGNIPIEDAHFKAYLVQNFDENTDGEISYAEAAKIIEIKTVTDSIVTVQGIEYMPKLKSLTITGSSSKKGKLTTLDLSNNIALTKLICYFNLINSIDLSRNKALASIDCSRNSLTQLDVTNNLALTSLSCCWNRLTSLDVSKNTKLRSLVLYQNQVTDLDVSNNKELENLGCEENNLTSLDVSNNSKLYLLNCGDNSLTSLDVSNNLALKYLYFYKSQLTSIDVSKNTALLELNCGANKLKSIDVSKNTALKKLYCFSNQLTALDISNNTAVTELLCHYNKLKSIDVSKNTALKELNCHSNQLTDLDISNNTALTELLCYNNKLINLDVSNNTKLQTLDCSPMKDNSGNNLLVKLYIFEGQVIPKITSNRSADNIPDATQIVVKNPIPEAVDLGLSVKWAPFNLGASAPEGYGDYFAWGETAPREEYDFGTYSLCDESYNSLQKYNNNSDYGIVDDKTVLEPEDDAAHVNWGSSWRMPTDAEFTELIQNCTCTLTTLNGIHGIRMTSNVEGYTDKSIFLPASGSRVGTRLLMIDARGTYWSSSLYTELSYKANTFDFYSSPQPGSNPLDRYTGLPVRPVCE